MSIEIIAKTDDGKVIAKMDANMAVLVNGLLGAIMGNLAAVKNFVTVPLTILDSVCGGKEEKNLEQKEAKEAKGAAEIPPRKEPRPAAPTTREATSGGLSAKRTVRKVAGKRASYKRVETWNDSQRAVFAEFARASRPLTVEEAWSRCQGKCDQKSKNNFGVMLCSARFLERASPGVYQLKPGVQPPAIAKAVAEEARY